MRSLTKATATPFLPVTRDDFFAPIEQQFDKFFDGFFNNHSLLDGAKSNTGYPKLDVVQDGDYWKIKAALPGVDIKNVNVEIEDDGLVKISGEMSQEYQTQNRDSHYFVKELHKSKFSRSLKLPKYIQGDPTASMKNGILTLSWHNPVKTVSSSKRIAISDGDAKTSDTDQSTKIEDTPNSS